MCYKNTKRNLLLFLILFCGLSWGDVRYPYPQARGFSIGANLPQWGQDSLNSVTLRKYAQFKRRYIQRDSTLNKSVYIRNPKLLPDNTIAYTDAAVHSQSMIIFALMAGADDESKTLFDGMYHFYKEHPLHKNSLRMQYYVCDSSKECVEGSYSADLDMAYALLLAHGQWGSDDEVAYLADAKRILTGLIAKKVIDPKTKRILTPDAKKSARSCIGDWRPSYFRAFHAMTGDSLFLSVAESLYATQKSIIHNDSCAFLPTYIEGEPAHACGEKHGINAGHFADEALLFPLQLSLDYIHFQNDDAMHSCKKMWHWVDKQYATDTTLPYAAYTVDGKPLTNYSSLQSVASFATTALTSEEPTPLLGELLTYLRERNGVDAKSHGVQLLSLLLLSGNWWSPIEALEETAVACTKSTFAPEIAVHGRTIEAQGLRGKNASVSLYSLQGDLLYKKSVEIVKRTLTQEFSYATLSEGFALLQLEGDGYTVLEKIFVSR